MMSSSLGYIAVNGNYEEVHSVYKIVCLNRIAMCCTEPETYLLVNSVIVVPHSYNIWVYPMADHVLHYNDRYLRIILIFFELYLYFLTRSNIS